MDGRWCAGNVQSLVSEGHLVERSCWSAYQLSRAGDCLLRLEEIPEVAVSKTCPSRDEQHHSDALSEQDGGSRSQD